MLHWLVEVANRPEEPAAYRAYTYPCPHGGEVTVAASEGHEGRLSGRWEVELDECGPGGHPRGMHPEYIHGMPTIPDGHFAFTSSETVLPEPGRRRLEAAVEAEFTWIWAASSTPAGIFGYVTRS